MTELQRQHGPFAFPAPGWFNGPTYFVTCDAQDRIRLVKESTDADWLEVVLAWPRTQKTVRQAAERRLRWVNHALAQLRAQAQESQ